jgi:uncharacterized membrane protein
MARASLTVWKFNGPSGADEASETLRALARRNVVTTHDAAIVWWEMDEDRPRTREVMATSGAGGLGGSFWGLLFGLIFFLPLLGAALGKATGALVGSLTDVGIDDGFINKVRDQVAPGTSALFLMTSETSIDTVRDAFADHQPGDLVFTNLETDHVAALRKVFAEG